MSESEDAQATRYAAVLEDYQRADVSIDDLKKRHGLGTRTLYKIIDQSGLPRRGRGPQRPDEPEVTIEQRAEAVGINATQAAPEVREPEATVKFSGHVVQRRSDFGLPHRRSAQALAQIQEQFEALTSEQRKAIRKARKKGKTYAQLMREFGVLNAVVSRVLNEPEHTVDQKLDQLAAAADPAVAQELDQMVENVVAAPADNAAAAAAAPLKRFSAIVLRQVISKRTLELNAENFLEATRQLEQMGNVIEILSLERSDYAGDHPPSDEIRDQQSAEH